MPDAMDFIANGIDEIYEKKKQNTQIFFIIYSVVPKKKKLDMKSRI